MGSSLAHFFCQIVSVTVKAIGKTNLRASRHIKREKALLPVDARPSTIPLLKLANTRTARTETLAALANSSTGIILYYS